MTAYVNIKHRTADGMPDTGRRAFTRVAALPPEQRAIWDRTQRLALEEWIYPFEAMNAPVALTIAIDERKICVVAGYVESPSDTFIQAVKPSAGYVSREFGKTGKGYLHGANVDSRAAREKGFLPSIMHAFNNIDMAVETHTVSIAAIGAGNYAWMSYGAVPAYRLEFSGYARGQWLRLCDEARARDLNVNPDLATWVHGIGQGDDATFRKPFGIDTDASLRQSLKALVTGDIAFLQNAQHRFQNYADTPGIYAKPLNATLEMKLQDADQQRHFMRRIMHAAGARL